MDKESGNFTDYPPGTQFFACVRHPEIAFPVTPTQETLEQLEPYVNIVLAAHRLYQCQGKCPSNCPTRRIDDMLNSLK